MRPRAKFTIDSFEVACKKSIGTKMNELAFGGVAVDFVAGVGFRFFACGFRLIGGGFRGFR